MIKAIIPFLFLCAISILGQSQSIESSTMPAAMALPSFPIKITVTKTTNLIFPFKIKNVDRGIEDLLVQQVEGADHILQIKAATAAMEETNLSVVTEDMQLYSFLVKYDSCPSIFSYSFKKIQNGSVEAKETSPAAPIHTKLNNAQIEQLAKQVASQKPFIKNIASGSNGVRFRVNGTFIQNDILFFSLQLENGTPIPYDIESLEIFIRDKKKGKMTATQEVVIPKYFAYGDTAVIDSHTGQRLVLAVSKFTIPDKKDCVIQLREGNGGRHLDFVIHNKQLMRAKEIETK